MKRENVVQTKLKSLIIFYNFIFSSLFIICSIGFSLLHKQIILYSALLFIIGLLGFFYSFKYKNFENKYTFIMISLISTFYSIFVLFLCLNFYFSSKDYTPKNQSIGVILGTVITDNMPSPLLKQRLDLGIENFENEENPLFIVSGTKNEANVMESYLLNKNITKDNILKDENAFDTYTNIKNTYKIIKDYDFSGKIMIFTNDFHCMRTTFYANKVLDIPFEVVCSKSDLSTFVVLSLREFLAFFKAIIIT